MDLPSQDRQGQWLVEVLSHPLQQAGERVAELRHEGEVGSARGTAPSRAPRIRCSAIRLPGDRLILVDTGVGPADSPAAAWAPVPGRLPAELVAAGIDPLDVDVVVLTHLHEDHFGWSVDAGGFPMFPNARCVVQQRELDSLPAGDLAVQYVVEPLRRAGVLAPVEGRVQLPEGSGSLGDTVVVVPTPGHTPGHQSVLVDSRGEQMIVTGDVLVHAVQVVDPDVGYRYESDQETARLTRRALLAEAGRSRRRWPPRT